ncbi:hypothetical protein F5Y04DRAFT_281882 [Hypomontagnella monticulosa]|nr:hypothetical protein F5Y04DRAFT_281882 [Hypomontagnella monticulosa]
MALRTVTAFGTVPVLRAVMAFGIVVALKKSAVTWLETCIQLTQDVIDGTKRGLNCLEISVGFGTHYLVYNKPGHSPFGQQALGTELLGFWSTMDQPSYMPEDLVDAYKQHKADTQVIAAWLAENASNCGYDVASESPQTQPADSTRVEDVYGAEGSYQVKLSSFIRLARAIAGHVPKVTVPDNIDETFSRVIESRKRCTEWFEARLGGDSEKDRRHRHFTTYGIGTNIKPFQERVLAPIVWDGVQLENRVRAVKPTDKPAGVTSYAGYLVALYESLVKRLYLGLDVTNPSSFRGLYKIVREKWNDYE